MTARVCSSNKEPLSSSFTNEYILSVGKCSPVDFNLDDCDVQDIQYTPLYDKVKIEYNQHQNVMINYAFNAFQMVWW